MTPPRDIYCRQCHKFLGTIRDATLRKGIAHLCSDCNSAGNLFDTLFRPKKK